MSAADLTVSPAPAIVNPVGLLAPGRNLPPCERDQKLDPATCEVMPGHQHPPDDVEELAESIAICGQIHPGQVFEFPDGRRWIAAGRRRWLACLQRNFEYRADVWQVPTESIAHSEQLAVIIRYAENEQRRDPGVYDLAVQLRNIKNEKGYETHEQVAKHVGMSATRVKTYLSIFKASEYLESAIINGNFSLAVAAELVHCENHFGPPKTRSLIRKVHAGKLSAADLERKRKIARHGKRGANAKDADAKWRAACNRLIALLKKYPDIAEARKAALLEQLEIPTRDTYSPPRVEPSLGAFPGPPGSSVDPSTRDPGTSPST